MQKPVNNSSTPFQTDDLETHHMPGKRSVTLSRFKRRILKHVLLVRALIILGIVGFLFGIFILASLFIQKSGFGEYLNLAKIFILAPRDKVRALEGRTNILILGKGGQGHEAPDLTDTLIFASISEKDFSIKTISLPRDIWIPELRTKLNSVYYWGKQKQEGGGIVLAKSTVETILDEPIHYALVIDFAGFKRVIDVLGGVEVDVQYSFTDEKYPIPGRENDLCGGDPGYKCRYETVKFDKGRQRMDGETALKFVRSRNAEGENGTDFARAERQQRIISGVKERILTKEVLLSKEKLLELIKVLEDYVETDIEDETGAVLARWVLQGRENTASFVLPEDLLVNPPYQEKYDNLYVLTPKSDSWGEVQSWVNCVLEREKCS